VSRTVAGLPEVRAPAIDGFAGYAQPVPLLQFAGRPVDFGVDAQGNFSVLVKEGGDLYRIHRYDPTGKQLAVWNVPLPPTINPATIAVAADGTTAVLVQRTVHLYDPLGKQIAEWEHPWFVWESQLAFWGDLLVANIHHRDSMAVYTRKGDLVTEFKTFNGGPGKLYAPMAFALSNDGDLLIQQLDGKALRFHLNGADFAPVFVEEFRVDAAMPGSGFDGPERALVPSESGLHAFGRGGNRLMAGDPARYPSQLRFGTALRIRRAGDRLLVLDSDRNTLWLIPG